MISIRKLVHLQMPKVKAKLNLHYVSEYILFYIWEEGVIKSIIRNPKIDSYEESAVDFWQDTSRKSFNHLPLLVTK